MIQRNKIIILPACDNFKLQSLLIDGDGKREKNLLHKGEAYSDMFISVV